MTRYKLRIRSIERDNNNPTKKISIVSQSSSVSVPDCASFRLAKREAFN